MSENDSNRDQDDVYLEVFNDILESSRDRISDIKPSKWNEERRTVTSDISNIPGKFSYENSPYLREVVDCLSPDHPAKWIAVMKGAQIGFSFGVIESAIAWIISENPGNILFLVGHEDVLKDAQMKIDRVIDGTGIRELIRSSSGRVRNVKSGDTDYMKEFPGGYMKVGLTNHKSLRNISMRYGFIDDFESMKGSTDQAGSTTGLIEQRFSSFYKKMKLFYISTPELKESSNIEPEYLAGDQRKFHIPCPCCGEMIKIEWEIEIEGKTKKGGITWKLDENDELIADSVGYICYKCEGFFDDSNKMEWLNQGVWIPTAKPSKPGYYSYHISALYAPVYMYDWEYYVRKWLKANPPNKHRNEAEYKTFINTVLGLTYEKSGKSVSANELQENIRDYPVGILPEKLSIKDGNGRIVLVTCGIDLNGKEDDARLDYEIVAFSETGATYSIDHGSIGTFVRFGKKRFEDRKKWTYRHGEENSVWPELQKLLNTPIPIEGRKNKMKIFMTGIDAGYQTDYVYQFIKISNNPTIAVMGKDEGKYVNLYTDRKTFSDSQSNRGVLYMVESNFAKDVLDRHMTLKWNEFSEEGQPEGYMNFPTPERGKYLFKNFFAHFEAEHKVLDKDNKKFTWVKKSDRQENHLYDCHIYAIVTKDILVSELMKEAKIKNGKWTDYVDIVLGR